MISRDLYKEITDKVVSGFESGVTPWTRPWSVSKGAEMYPKNYCSGKYYRGINVLLLWATGYSDMRFATYKQWADKGAQVRKGEKGTQVILFKPITMRDKVEPENKKDILLMRSFTVFNISQVDGIKEDIVPVELVPVQMQYTTAVEFESLAKYVHGGNRAFYRIEGDTIHMPNIDQFKSEGEYHATALHELTHWTGIEKRCDRQFGKRFGDQAYAFEELVAEMGAAFLCGHAGIEYQTQHASYIKSWCDILKGDKKSIITAASQAQKACDYVLKQVAKVDIEEEEAEESEA
jgi:antirestriction protein ArdC